MPSSDRQAWQQGREAGRTAEARTVQQGVTEQQARTQSAPAQHSEAAGGILSGTESPSAKQQTNSRQEDKKTKTRRRWAAAHGASGNSSRNTCRCGDPPSQPAPCTALHCTHCTVEEIKSHLMSVLIFLVWMSYRPCTAFLIFFLSARTSTWQQQQQVVGTQQAHREARRDQQQAS